MSNLTWHYFYVFMQSNLLELPFYYFILRKFAPGLLTRSLYESERVMFFLCAVTALNSVTHPLMFFGIMNLKMSYITSVVAAQTFAVVSEAMFMKWLLDIGTGRAIFAALIANIASWQLAPLVTSLIF